ncbi:MAG: hypothetical protein H8D47_04485 [Planctomycetes bacterium]|nr:hypothetical protein [Planctomycetota bacterium]
MKLPQIKNGEKYVSLYVVDFGDHCGVGFTGCEVEELLESEKYADVKVYKIHNAYPDGRMELKGVRAETFSLESGMFFYAADQRTADRDYNSLVALAIRTQPPCRAKVQLAKLADDKFVTAYIYPAEYDDEISKWLLDGEYRAAGFAEGGFSAIEGYYAAKPEIIETHQLFGSSDDISRTGQELFTNLKVAVQR